MKPRLLDLFCGAGGAAMGYHRAGFDVVGIDISPQPRYPFEFVQMDAIQALEHTNCLSGYAAVHASPPCQAYSDMSNCRPGLGDEYPQLIEAVRNRLAPAGVPWVIENVAGSELATQDDLFGARGVLLCGLMFGLPLYRHRLFEASFPVAQPHHPRHLTPASKAGHWEPGTVISVAGNCAPIQRAREAMGIGWTTRDELAEAIPPPFTEHVGRALLEHLRERAA